MMNVIENLQKRIAQDFPDVSALIDGVPVVESGFWILDVRREDTLHLYLQGTVADSTVGVSDISPPRDVGFGEGVDEILPNEDAAYEWVAQRLAVAIT